MLRSLATAVDIGPQIVTDALADDSAREQLEAVFQEAKERGITGVPAFVYGDHVARGAVPPVHIKRLVEGV